MVKIIKTNNQNNYMIDKLTEQVIEKYDPKNKDLVLVTRLEDGSILNVEANQIHQQYGGSIYFDYLEDRYLIDDDYQDVLIRCGYIVMDNFDQEKFNDKSEGLRLRKDLLWLINNTLIDFVSINNATEYSILNSETINELKVEFIKDGFKFTIYFNTVNNIVSKNQQRKLNQLPFYPFKKDMDKYGTIYVSLFCQKLEHVKVNNRYDIAEEYISNFIKLLSSKSKEHQFHYIPLMIKKRIMNWEGL